MTRADTGEDLESDVLRNRAWVWSWFRRALSCSDLINKGTRHL